MWDFSIQTGHETKTRRPCFVLQIQIKKRKKAIIDMMVSKYTSVTNQQKRGNGRTILIDSTGDKASLRF